MNGYNPVEDQLKCLIIFYKEEQVRLQRRIDECVAEADYLMAHHHSIALQHADAKLRTLNNIDDNLYHEKDFKQSTINDLQERVATESSGYMKERYEQWIQRLQEELEALNQIPGRAALPDHADLLDEILKNLMEQKIKDLKLILKKESDFLLEFSYSNKTLKVTLPDLKRHVLKRTLIQFHIKRICKLGFDLADHETKLILTLTGTKEYILKTLKIILLKIVFEIFNEGAFDGEHYFKFTDKAG